MIIVRCAKCDKQVDKIECQYDPYLDEWHFKVWCHGATDECTVGASFIRSIDPRDLEGMKGNAFVTEPALRNVPDLRDTASGHAGGD